MAIHRLAKDQSSRGKGGCPALYATDDPSRMIAQGPVLPDAEFDELLEIQPFETAVAIPTETVLRGVAKYATEHGADDLTASIEAFLAQREL